MKKGSGPKLNISAAALSVLTAGKSTCAQVAELVESTRASIYITLERHRIAGRVRRERSGREFLYTITSSGINRLEWIEENGGIDGEKTVRGMFGLIKSSVSKYLRQVEAIPLSNPSKFSMDPGVYFLLDGNEIVYIGKSDKAISERLSDYIDNPGKKTYTVKHLPVGGTLGKVSMRRVEDWLILAFRPKENGGGQLW